MNFQNYEEIFDEKNYPVFKRIGKGFYIPEDEGTCVCLSGKKYKNCCKDEIESSINNLNDNVLNNFFNELYNRKNGKMISNEVENKSINKKKLSYCSAHRIFGGCNVLSSNTRSHTMSCGNVLKNLADNELLICFNDHRIYNPMDVKSNISEYYLEKSIKDASVNVSFCKKHDIELFKEIETAGNTTYHNTDIENLEYSLKSISFEVYYKIMNIRYLAKLISENKLVAYENIEKSKSIYFYDYYIDILALFELHPLMLTLLSEIKELKQNNIKPKIKTIFFKLPLKKVNFSCSEVIELWNTHCFINVINSPNPFIIISYYEKDEKMKELEELKKSYESITFNRCILKELYPLIKLILINAQNIYFNKKAFENMPDETKLFLYVVHKEGTKGISSSVKNINYETLFDFLFPL